jgi:transposase
VFTWRRQARQPVASAEAPKFVPAIVEAALPAGSVPGRPRKRTRRVGRPSGSIEVEIDGVMVRIGHGAEARTVAAVLRALKAST